MRQGCRGRVKVYGLVSAFVVGGLLVVEALLAGLFVLKHHVEERPMRVLMERYYVLRPFLLDAPQGLPEGWLDSYAGLFSTPGVKDIAYIPDPLVGYRLAPNLTLSHRLGRYTTTNEQGLIASYVDRRTYSREPAADTYRILVLGGSTVEGFGASNSLHTLPALLGEELTAAYVPAQAGKTAFEIINGGVSGYTSLEEYLYATNELLLFKPHLVISYNGYNDMGYTDQLLEQYDGHVPGLQSKFFARNTDLLHASYRIPALFMRALSLGAYRIQIMGQRIFIVHVVRQVLVRGLTAIGMGDAQNNVSEKITTWDPQGVDLYVRNIQRLKGELDRQGIHYAWFRQPMLVLDNREPVGPREVRFKQQEAPFFDQRFIDQRVQFYALTEEKEQEMQAANGRFCSANVSDVFDDAQGPFYMDYVHLLDRGNERVAQRIASELQQCGLVVLKGANPSNGEP